jgi:hypothetical protein
MACPHRFERARARPSLAKRWPLYSLVSRVLLKRVRVPARPELLPTGKVDLPEVLERWKVARTSLMASASASKEGMALSLQPPLGALDAHDTLRLLNAHLSYHEAQLCPEG